jgi:hypothetical protein
MTSEFGTVTVAPNAGSAATGVLLTAEAEIPCWHKKKRRRKDAKRGRPHGKTHPVTRPIGYYYPLDGAKPVENEGTFTVVFNTAGTFTLT